MASDSLEQRLPPVVVESEVARHVASAIAGKCGRCARSLCCRYITQEIDTPRSRYDFDHLLWQISHRGVGVFKDEEGWYLIVDAVCQYLQDDGSCGIYAQRPRICREHSNEFCDFDAPLEQSAELYFPDPVTLEHYCRKRFKTWDRRHDDWQRNPPD